MYGHVVLLVASVAAASGAREFSKPVIDGEDNPDPGVLFHDGAYYAVTTSNNGASNPKFPIHYSVDLQNWTTQAHVFTKDNIPIWTEAGHEFWAPELHIINNNFLVYFASRDTASNQMAVGVASSESILGPYQATDSPLILNLTTGNIDSTVLTDDDGAKYLVWKEEPTLIYARKLSEDGLSFASDEKHELLRNGLGWEGPDVEGPWFVKRGDYFYLFYTGSFYCDVYYAVGVARSKDALGPYEKHGDPILVSTDDWKGPGHCSVVKDVNDGDNYVLVYHAWRSGQMCGDNNRLMMVSSIAWSDDGWPLVVGI